MRRLLVFMVIFMLVILIAGVSSGSALARSGPFLPGDPLFRIQYYAERTQGRFGRDSEQTEWYFELAERRLEDLVVRIGTSHELEALRYLEEAVEQVIQSLANQPDEVLGYRDRLTSLIELSSVAVNMLTISPTENPDQVAFFVAQLSTLKKLRNEFPEVLFESDIVTSENSPTAFNRVISDAVSSEETGSQSNSIIIPFPSGGPASQHAFFPLIGEHIELACEDCHGTGEYKGTPSDCETCHVGVRPEDHYLGDCAVCHTPETWGNIIFDHATSTTSDCVSCHENDRPVNHYGNQCVACHNHMDWMQASFNHQVAGAKDCQACHISIRPAGHYSGQCSQCHNTGSWQDAVFDHSGQANCQSCHSGDRPANHFSGQCSSCHSTQTWRGASFNHNGHLDCKTCHSQDRPSSHFGGQCSQCHRTNRWEGAEFNHDGQSDCKACHAGDRPGDHSNSQCSQCHNPRNWDDADDDDGGDGGKDDDD